MIKNDLITKDNENIDYTYAKLKLVFVQCQEARSAC